MNGTPYASAPASLPLERPIHEQSGLLSWVATVDHKRIGIMYLWVSLIFFLVGGIEALLMRIQLARPNNSFLSPDAFNQIFTMHGTTMIFLVAMPVLTGMANYLVPLMIGAKDMAFPRLNALSLWLLAFGGLLLYFSFIAGGAPAAGWFSYAPLSERPYSSTSGVDYYAISLLVLGIASIAAAINLIVTISNCRAPGLTIRRLPLFVWMVLITQILILLALPALNASLAMLLIDRLLNGNFFMPLAGGSAILWQHFFWSFGHPEVYIVVLPAFGMISEVIPVFSGKVIYGYEFVAASTVAIATLSFLVWAHHMFTVGLGHPVDLMFAVGSMLIAVPTGIKIFNWIATMWGGSIRFTTSMLFAVGFLVMFTIGGLSGLSFAAFPIDWQVTDTYYLVAHIHYVLFGGTIFAVFAGLYYWFPKISGRMLSETLGKWNFWLMLVGFNMTFLDQHFLGLIGMTRRTFTYPDLPGWGPLNLISSIGAGIMGLAAAVFLWNIAASLLHGKIAGDNPWNAWTLEWATTSPPPYDNFKRIPPIRSRRPLWDLTHPENPDWKHEAIGNSGRVNSGTESNSEYGIALCPRINSPRITAPVTSDSNRFGMILFLLSEASFFAFLIVAYVYFHGAVKDGPTALNSLAPWKSGIYTVCLLFSSFTMWRAEASYGLGRNRAFMNWLQATILLGAIFLFGQVQEYLHLYGTNVTVSRNIFGTAFFTLTGFHGLHVLLGLIVLAILYGLLRAGSVNRHPSVVRTLAVYWHFVDWVWVVIFSVVYLWDRF